LEARVTGPLTCNSHWPSVEIPASNPTRNTG